MNDIRPILYGVSDYAQIRKKNAWFVDNLKKTVAGGSRNVLQY